MINCIAIDDEPLALEIIEAFCRDIPFLNLDKTFTDTQEAAKHLRKFPVELLFLDIQMPDISGLDFYKLHAPTKMAIFTTAYSQHAVDGFNLKAIDYLLKPFTRDRFIQAVDKAHEYYNYLYKSPVNAQSLFVRSDYSLVKIPFDEIVFIETLDDYLKIHLTSRKPVVTKMNLKNVIGKLPEHFIRVHRSYIVSLKSISAVRGKNILLDSKEIPIGIKYEADFFKNYISK